MLNGFLSVTTSRDTDEADSKCTNSVGTADALSRFQKNETAFANPLGGAGECVA